jgi:WD40 repeat protein
LASGGPDKTVLLWENKKASPGIRINAHKDKVYCCRFNENGKLLATCGEQGELFIWDLAKAKEPLARIDLPFQVLYDIQWSGSEDLFFVTTLGAQLLAFGSKSFKQVCSHAVIEGESEARCESVAANFKQIGNTIFCGNSKGTISWYEMETGQLSKLTEWTGHLDSVRTLTYHPTRQVFLSTGRDGSAKLWDASRPDAQPSILGNLVFHGENIPGAGFLGHDKVVTGSWDQKLALWSIKDLLK